MRVTPPVGDLQVPEPVVIHINDHIVGFYVGRDLTGPSPLSNVDGNWVDVDWGLGEINYAIYKSDWAIVYDTMLVPAVEQWVRDYLENEMGIQHFIVVLSHWHLDHIAGNSLYKDSPVVALELTRQVLESNGKAIRAGTLWGPPALDLMLPNITFVDRLDLYVGKLKVELHRFNIESKDANLLYIPEDRLLLAGDALEDSVTYISEPADLATHINELNRLKMMDICRIYPQHGDPAVIESSGYTKAFIDATIEYDRNLLHNVQRPDFLCMRIEDFMPKALAEGTVSIWEPYVAIHEQNLSLLHDYYKNRPISEIP